MQKFIAHVAKEKLFSATDHLLIAVSGGLDSVVLCHLCKEAGYTFSIAHCHFGLRGAESDRDAAFVKAFSETLGVPFFLKHFDTSGYASEKKMSTQLAARELRYQWFAQLMAEDLHLKWLLTAHHADDQAETVMMQFCKGSGLKGLVGIPQRRGVIIRPLLFATRENITAYAKDRGLMWVEDSSNDEIKYTRNFFRHSVIPAIEKVFPQVKNNIRETAAHLKEAVILYNQAVDQQKAKLLLYKGPEVHIPVLKLARVKPLNTVIFEIIKDYSFTPQQTREVEKLLDAESGKFTTSATHRILRNRKWLIISPLGINEQSVIVINEDTDSIEAGNGRISVKIKDAEDLKLDTNSSVAYLDAKELSFPLLLRRWKAGDYFYPLGMQKKKKLSRFFIDQKLSLGQKENIWVIESGKRIAWVVNHRIDDRFKIRPGTKKVIQFTWSSL